jgi:hypothetical protein
VYSHVIDDGVEEYFDGDSDEDSDEADDAEIYLGGLEHTSTYGGKDVEEEAEEFMGDGWAERGAAARGEPYAARDHDSRSLISTFPAQHSSRHPAGSLKNAVMAIWEEPQLGVFKAARSHSESSSTATWTR